MKNWVELAVMKKLGVILFSCLISILVFGAVLEVILRLGIIANPRYDRRQVQANQKLPKHKLLIIGDSFITDRTLLGRLLSQDLRSYDVALLNAATGGTGPFEYLEEMKTIGAEFKPDVVLLSYYVGNDLTDVQNHPSFGPAQRWDQRTGLAINSSSTRPYFRNLYLYHYILGVSQRIRSTRFNYEEIEAAGIPADLIEDAKLLKINPWLLKLAVHRKNYFLDNLLMETDGNMRAWQKVKELLTEIHEICKRQKSQLVMAIFPASVQVNESHFEFLKRLKFNMDERTLVSVKPQRLLMEFCADRNILCLDFLSSLRARKNEEFYRNKDGHLNDAGNRLAEMSIVGFILKNTVIGDRLKTPPSLD